MAREKKNYWLCVAAGCMCALLVALVFASRESGGQPLPPGPESVIGRPIGFRALVDFRNKDRKAIERLLSEQHEELRKDTALRQLEALVPFYLSWSEQCSVAEGGIKVYGPRASAWLNEILWAMVQREDILHGVGRNWKSQPSRERAPGARYWTTLGGLDGDPYLWSVFIGGDGDKTLEIPEEEAREMVINALKNIKYPFDNMVFSGVEIYVLPSQGMFEFDKNTSYGKCAVGRTTGKGYSPEDMDRFRTGPRQVRVLIAGVDGINKENTLCHELGHAWVRVLQNHGAKGILAAWAEWRKPYIPEGIDTASLDDDYKATGGWNERPEEVLAEDFVRLFGGGKGRDNWPVVEDLKVQEGLARFFIGEVICE